MVDSGIQYSFLGGHQPPACEMILIGSTHKVAAHTDRKHRFLESVESERQANAPWTLTTGVAFLNEIDDRKRSHYLPIITVPTYSNRDRYHHLSPQIIDSYLDGFAWMPLLTKATSTRINSNH